MSAVGLAALHQPFVNFGSVPIADGHDLEDLTFVVSTRQATAVIQFSGSDFPIGGQQRSDSCPWRVAVFWKLNCFLAGGWSWRAGQKPQKKSGYYAHLHLPPPVLYERGYESTTY